MLIATGLTVIMAGALSSVVWATIASTSGQVTKIAAPPSVELGQLESSTTMFAFDERQCVALLSPLKVNISAPGTYVDSALLTPGKIPAGTAVSSHFVQADKEGTANPKITLEATITTDGKVLGIITSNTFLGTSDFLGAIGTVYPTGSAHRAMQFNGTTDSIVLDAGLQTVTIHTVNSAHADQVRVITECKLPPPPPPPGLGAQGCTPGYWKQDQHFDSWVGYLPTDSFNTVFGISSPFPNSLTLLDALGQGGGGIYALGRHAVAALLDSSNPDVDYALSGAQVIAKTKAAYESGDATLIEGTKNLLSQLNERGCPLN